MERTVPPWVTSWSLGHRNRIGSRPRDDYWHTPRLRLYTHYLRPGDQHANSHPIFRFQDGLGNRVVFPTPANPWLQKHLPDDTEPWRLPILPPDLKDSDPFELYIPERPPPPPTPAPPVRPHSAPHHAWADSTLGWVAGTVLLAVFVLIVRATEKCLDRRLFKARRRQSEEWPTANVLATSHQHAPPDIPSRPDSGLQMDLPPPYSECARPKSQCEDPPPPYSDCYVAFINPKDGVPSAHIMMRERDDVGSNVGGTEETIGIHSNESQENARPEDEHVKTICDIIVETNIGVVGVTTRNQDNVDVGNIGTVCANVGEDIEANTNSRIETIGVHIGANASNGSISRDSAILRTDTLQV